MSVSVVRLLMANGDRVYMRVKPHADGRFAAVDAMGVLREAVATDSFVKCECPLGYHVYVNPHLVALIETGEPADGDGGDKILDWE